MFLLFISLVLVVVASLYMFVIGKKNVLSKTDEFTKYDAGKTLMIIAIVFSSIVILVNFSNYSSQVSSFENARNIQRKIDILRTRYNELYATFAQHLAKEYPNLEKEILSKISPAAAGSLPLKGESLNVILLRYPDLKSSVTLCKLVDETKKIADDMYAKQIDAQEIYEKIRYRAENPWIILKKDIPADIYDDVYYKKTK